MLNLFLPRLVIGQPNDHVFIKVFMCVYYKQCFENLDCIELGSFVILLDLYLISFKA